KPRRSNSCHRSTSVEKGRFWSVQIPKRIREFALNARYLHPCRVIARRSPAAPAGRRPKGLSAGLIRASLAVETLEAEALLQPGVTRQRDARPRARTIIRTNVP